MKAKKCMNMSKHVYIYYIYAYICIHAHIYESICVYAVIAWEKTMHFKTMQTYFGLKYKMELGSKFRYNQYP